MPKPLDPTVVSATAATSGGARAEAFCAACGQSFPFEHDVCPNDGARLTKLAAQEDSLLGRVFDGRYEIRTALGQGGMGTVYRGWQLSVDREVAIKVIHPKLASDRTVVKRFLREARLSSRLSQPSIVNVYDFGQTDDGILFLVMELLRGHTLASELETMKPLTTKRIVTIAQQLCDALDSAHAQGIVHRDLKPGNVMLLDDPPGRDLIKVLDFGLAKSLVTDTHSQVTNTDAIIGTPLYMPPEQIEGKPSDHRADLYALGCMLHHMVSGRPPFLGDTTNAVLTAHLDEVPPSLPGAPPVLANLITRLMAKDQVDRVSSAAEVRAILEPLVVAGFATSETRDLVDVRALAATAVSADSTIGLAVTDPIGDSSGIRRSTTAAAPPVSPPAAPKASSTRWIALVMVGAIALAFAVIWIFVPESAAPDRPGVVPDAAQPAHAVIDGPAVDLADRAATDAAPAIDAGALEPPRDAREAPPSHDAGVRPRLDGGSLPRVDAPVRTDAVAPAPVDGGAAASAEAGTGVKLEFYRPDASPR